MLLTLLIVYGLLQIADFVTTYKGLSSRRTVEGNKFLVWCISKIGLAPALLIIKIFSLGAGLVAFSIGSVLALSILVIIYLLIVINNFRILY